VNIDRIFSTFLDAKAANVVSRDLLLITAP